MKPRDALLDLLSGLRKWRFTFSNVAYVALMLAGFLLLLRNRVTPILKMLAVGLLVVSHWRIAQQKHLQTNLISKQDELWSRLDETHRQVCAFKDHLDHIQSEARTHAQRVRSDALDALQHARDEWALLLSAEREQFASQLRDYRSGNPGTPTHDRLARSPIEGDVETITRKRQPHGQSDGH